MYNVYVHALLHYNTIHVLHSLLVVFHLPGILLHLTPTALPQFLGIVNPTLLLHSDSLFSVPVQE